MSVRQGLEPDHYAESGAQASQGRVRLQDLLVSLVIGAVILVLGYNLGQFTFNEIAGRGTAYFVLAAALGVALTALAYYKIELVMLGFMAIVWVAIGTTPDVASGVTTGSGKSLGLSQIGVAFLLFVWLLRAAARRQWSVARLPINGLLIAYLLFNVWSVFNGLLFWDPAVAHFWGPPVGGRTPSLVNLFEIVVRLLSAGAFWLFANNLSDEKWVRRASWLLLLPGTACFLSYMLHLHLPVNGYTVLLEIVVACTLFAWLIEPRLPDVPARQGLRFWGWLVLGLIVFQMFRLNINWVSGWFGLFVGLYTVAFLRSKKLFFGMALIGLVLYLAGHAFLQATVVHKVHAGGDMYRFSMAHGALLYALKYPLGVGPGNYRAYNLFYGLPKIDGGWGTSPFPFSHSFYSQTLAELGFGGLLLTVLWVLAGVTMVARFYRQMSPGPSRTFLLGLAGMWVGICASSGIGDYLIPVYYNNAVATMATTIYAWFGLGIAVAHARLFGLDHADRAKPAAPATLPEAAAFYPRRLGGDPASPLPHTDSYYPRRMGSPRE